MVLVMASIFSMGQTILTSDNFGTVAQNPINRTGWVAVSTGSSNWELRTTGSSSGYSWTNPSFSASGGANVFTNLSGVSITKSLTYDNSLSTSGYINIQVRFGGVKSGTVPNLDIQYSTDGSSYTSAGTVSLGTSWSAYTINLPSAAEGASNLRIRFQIVTNNNSSNNFRIDDFQVVGILNTPAERSHLLRRHRSFYRKPGSN